MVKGYKCFGKGLACNCNDLKMEEHKIYTTDEDISYGKGGFHFCLRLEDTLRYFGSLDDKKEICEVTALGDVVWSFDDYNAYYDMGCTNKISIDKIMSEEDIIKYANKLNANRFIRFIQGYKLSNEALIYFKDKYKNNEYVTSYIEFYQEKQKDAFIKKYDIKKKIRK